MWVKPGRLIRDASGNFLSGWKLNPQQLEHVLMSGTLGGLMSDMYTDYGLLLHSFLSGASSAEDF
jgi:hypothetical protein